MAAVELRARTSISSAPPVPWLPSSFQLARALVFSLCSFAPSRARPPSPPRLHGVAVELPRRALPWSLPGRAQPCPLLGFHLAAPPVPSGRSSSSQPRSSLVCTLSRGPFLALLFISLLGRPLFPWRPAQIFAWSPAVSLCRGLA
ncbi:hypothetical protein Zm00014a_036240 [Zea mays]|uniref:Uncharacterized protein n=2 Tax=Zea mays TaxID=4577 RepID=A0A8J8Y8I6_MAIZE|nr:hypothetical protein ZEAMMB73_Zm00001d041071 [Zea mays]PWZ32794.1 hypothetical protein Zm00014a_036240 [Zea mays]